VKTIQLSVVVGRKSGSDLWSEFSSVFSLKIEKLISFQSKSDSSFEVGKRPENWSRFLILNRAFTSFY